MASEVTMSAETAHDDHPGHGSTGLYLTVFFALCILTSLSFLTYFDFWRDRVSVGVSRTFMMAVSCSKAMLVITFFMHLKWETNWKWMLTIPASLMSIFLMIVLVPDIGLRMRHASQDRMIYAAEVQAEEQADHSHESEDEHSEHSHEAEHESEHPST